MISPATEALEEAVRGYVAAGSGLDFDTHVIPGNSRGAATDGLYATVLLINQAIQGIPSTRFTLSDAPGLLDAPTQATVRDRYSVQWFRAGARDAARRFSVWVSSPMGLDYMAARGLGFLKVSSVRQLDNVISGAWEERAGLDLDICYVETVRLEGGPVGVIGSVPIRVYKEQFIERIEVSYDA